MMHKMLAVTLGVTSLVLLTLALYVLGVWPFNGVTVAVRNMGSASYSSCRVIVTGAAYELGPFKPGDTLSANVWPTGDSTVLVELKGDGDSAQTLDADCYLCNSGDSGTIRIDIDDGVVTNVDDQVGFQILW